MKRRNAPRRHDNQSDEHRVVLNVCWKVQIEKIMKNTYVEEYA